MNTDFFNQTAHTPVETVTYTTPDRRQVTLNIKRDDLIDFSISGNKWRKLKHNFFEAQRLGRSTIASFGGAFSNHIAALSAAGFRAGVKTIGFIRTHEIDLANPTLKLAKANGMELVALSRMEYRRRHDPEFLAELQEAYPNCFWVPEGGSNEFAAKGVEELANEIMKDFSVSSSFSSSSASVSEDSVLRIVCPVGSGGTISGLAKALPLTGILGIAVVNDTTLMDNIQARFANTKIVTESIHGGYGKVSESLLNFCDDFASQTGIAIEPIYSGKMFYCLCIQNVLTNEELAQTIVIHTGGLQGLEGLRYRGFLK